MTKEQQRRYQDTDSLKKIITDNLKHKKFKLDCGHYVTICHQLGADITIRNGVNLKIICSQCGY
ncbi:MAG: hypothetical protein HQK63_16090 [Desulfamplus sp.]|nr:hypothetical protein [Desulfamplus sp.]